MSSPSAFLENWVLEALVLNIFFCFLQLPSCDILMLFQNGKDQKVERVCGYGEWRGEVGGGRGRGLGTMTYEATLSKYAQGFSSRSIFFPSNTSR